MGRRHKPQPTRGTGNTKFKTDRSANSELYSNHEDEMSGNQDVQVCCFSGVVLLAIYLKCLYPSIPGGDAGELIVSAHELGVAHPPGYPLFTMLSKLSMLFIPFGSPAWKVNLLTAICSALSGSVLQLAVLKITGCMGSSFLVVSLFSLSSLTWTWSIGCEVFALNNLFIALLMYLAVKFEQDDDHAHVEKYASLGAFVCGLALCNQHTIVIYVVCLGLWVLLRLIKLRVSKLQFLKHGMMFLAGLSPYLYLPWSTHLGTARWTWGDHTTLEGFLTHFLRREYGTFDLGKDQTGAGFLSGLRAYWEHTHQDLCELGPFLALIGVAVAFIWRMRCEGTSVFVFSCMLTIYTIFFLWRANLDISNPLFKGVVERFWMQSDMVLCLLAGVGYHMAVKLITEILLGTKHLPMVSIFSIMGAAIVIILQLKNFNTCDESNNFVVHNFAKSLLEKMPKNAIVLTKGDLPTNTMRYFHLVENVRPDVQLLDVEIMTYGWFLPLLRYHYPDINFPGDFWHLQNQDWPDGRVSFNFKTFLDNNYGKRPILACIGMQERDTSWKDSYLTLPFGPCQQLEANKFSFDPVKWGNHTGGFADDWPYPHDMFGTKTWEKVANDEMWQAKIGTAFFMYQQSQMIKDTAAKTQLLLQSFELYFRAIKMNQIPGKMVSKEGFPHFWYKNFALACEKLLHLDHTVDKTKLCKLAISNFNQYLHLEPADPDSPKIEEAIGILSSRMDTLQKLDSVDKHLESMAKQVDSIGLSDIYEG